MLNARPLSAELGEQVGWVTSVMNVCLVLSSMHMLTAFWHVRRLSKIWCFWPGYLISLTWEGVRLKEGLQAAASCWWTWWQEWTSWPDRKQDTIQRSQWRCVYLLLCMYFYNVWLLYVSYSVIHLADLPWKAYMAGLNLADFRVPCTDDVSKWLPSYLTWAYSHLISTYEHSKGPSSPSRTIFGIVLSYLCLVFRGIVMPQIALHFIISLLARDYQAHPYTCLVSFAERV